MAVDYQQVLDFLVQAGNRIKPYAGQSSDIGTKEECLTRHDLQIEREFESLLKQYPGHQLRAEEEHAASSGASVDLWVMDPISGTKLFLQGAPHYAIVVSHYHKSVPQFAAVYDPSVVELFTAYRGHGAFLNGRKITVSAVSVPEEMTFLFNLSPRWPDKPYGKRVFDRLTSYQVYRNRNSFALNYCYVACGRYDGVVALTKDAYPEMAGKLIIEEARGAASGMEGADVTLATRCFIGGNPAAQRLLATLLG